MYQESIKLSAYTTNICLILNEANQIIICYQFRHNFFPFFTFRKINLKQCHLLTNLFGKILFNIFITYLPYW